MRRQRNSENRLRPVERVPQLTVMWHTRVGPCLAGAFFQGMFRMPSLCVFDTNSGEVLEHWSVLGDVPKKLL